MILGDLISKITSRVSVGTAKTPRSFESKAMFHWKLLLNTFFVMTLLVFAASYFVYLDISRGDFSPVTKVVVPGSSQVTIERLEKLVKHFETKSVTFEQMRKNRVSTVDPSR